MNAALGTPIIDDRSGSTHHFNGRLITAEDLAREQRSLRHRVRLTGHAGGTGVAVGLNVSSVGTVSAPAVTVTAGLALAANGATLQLPAETTFELRRRTSSSTTNRAIGTGFAACTTDDGGFYLAGHGLYLLVIGEADPVPRGRAPLGGLHRDDSPCQIDQHVDAVRVRLVEIPAASELQSSTHSSRWQALIADAFLGVADAAIDAWATPPFLRPAGSLGYIERVMTTLSAGDVPLALIWWTSDRGVQFVDQWAVRRRVHRSPTVATDFDPIADAALAAAEARLQHFHALVADAAQRPTSASMKSDDLLARLPAAGMLPVAWDGADGFDVRKFFGDQMRTRVRVTDFRRVQGLMRDGLRCSPIIIGHHAGVRNALRVYLIREVPSVVAFASTEIPDISIARFAASNSPTADRFGHSLYGG